MKKIIPFHILRPHLKPRVSAYFAYWEYIPVDINYVYIMESKGKFLRISKKAHATRKMKTSMAKEFMADY